MPTERQRKREERFRRHGVDRPESPEHAEKLEREAEEGEAKATKGKRGGAKSRKRSSSSASRGRKPVPYPTIKRGLIRAPLFGVFWFVIMRFFLSPETRTVNEDLLQAAILTVVMLPLLFMTDMITYRLASRRGVPVEDRPLDGYLGFRK